MYTSAFGLSQKPFNATPDPRFFYTNRGYQEAYATLLYGIQECKGFIALTGEVGTGKTTLLRRLMDNMNPAIKVVFLYNTTLTFDELVEFICAELELTVSGLSRVARLQALNAFLLAEAQRGGTVVLLLDEAQNLSAEALENLRLMSNLETATAKLLQIVLAGQPELETKLADPGLRQVSQRIAVRYRMERLADAEIEPYIDYRLRMAGRDRRALFSDQAVRTLIPYVNGIPRLINIVCDNALVLAYAMDARRVNARMIEDVVEYLRLAPRGVPDARRRAAVMNDPPTAAGGVWRWAMVGGGATVLAFLGIAVVGLGPTPRISGGLPSLGSLTERALPTENATTVARGAAPSRLGAAPRTETAPADRAAAAAPAALTSASLAAGGRDVPPVPAAVEPPRSSAPPAPPAASEDGKSTRSGAADIVGRRVTIPRGATISQIVLAHYGRFSSLALDVIQELNQGLGDIDEVLAGQSLWLPPLNLDALLRRQADGSYRLIVASHPSAVAAARIAESVRGHGYAPTVTMREVSLDQVLYRVEITKLTTRAAAMRAWETAKSLEWFDVTPEAPSRRERAAKTAPSSQR
jgi:general secretion pathway protein A